MEVIYEKSKDTKDITRSDMANLYAELVMSLGFNKYYVIHKDVVDRAKVYHASAVATSEGL